MKSPRTYPKNRLERPIPKVCLFQALSKLKLRCEKTIFTILALEMYQHRPLDRDLGLNTNLGIDLYLDLDLNVDLDLNLGLGFRSESGSGSGCKINDEKFMNSDPFSIGFHRFFHQPASQPTKFLKRSNVPLRQNSRTLRESKFG